MKKRSYLTSCIIWALFSQSVFAAEPYDSSQSYPGGAMVITDGHQYKAKWWVNPGQSPVDLYANEWDSPWETVGSSGGTTTPPVTGGGDGDDEEQEKPEQPDTGDFPEYSAGTPYSVGAKVRAVGTKDLYECKVAPWCSGGSSAWAYEPKNGVHWQEAWTRLGDDGSTNPLPPGGGGKPNPDEDSHHYNDGDTGDRGSSHATTDFDYRNSVEGRTNATIHYNKQGKISAEDVTKRNSKKIVGGYVSEWSVYGRGFDLERLSSSAYNRLVYAFAGICGDRTNDVIVRECQKQGLPENSMVIMDPEAGFYKPISARQKNLPWDPSFASGRPADIPVGKERGLMGQLRYLKQQNKDLKVALSVGGWTLSEPFHRLAANPHSRKVLVDSVVAFVEKWGIDGVDVDWEYPGQGGASGQYTTDDGKNFALLIKEMKLGLNALSQRTGKTYEVSSAVGATDQYIGKIGEHYKMVNEYIDNIYLMNYDYFGNWDKYLGHQSNLFHSSSLGANHSVENAIGKMQSFGVSKDKILVGVANYSRGNQAKLLNASPVRSEHATGKTVFGTHEGGVVEGYDLFPNMAGSDLLGTNGFQLKTDAEANADYYYNYETDIYHSIDTPRTAYKKAKYVNDNGLKGVFVWTVEQDFDGNVVNAMNDGVGNLLTAKYATPEVRAKRYNTCGLNITQSECDALNGGYIDPPTIGSSVPPPVEGVGTEYRFEFKNEQGLGTRFRVWEGKTATRLTPLLLQGGSAAFTYRVTSNTRVEVLTDAFGWHHAGEFDAWQITQAGKKCVRFTRAYWDMVGKTKLSSCD